VAGRGTTGCLDIAHRSRIGLLPFQETIFDLGFRLAVEHKLFHFGKAFLDSCNLLHSFHTVPNANFWEDLHRDY